MILTYYGTGAAEAIPAMFCRCDTCVRAAKNGGKDIRTRNQVLVNGKLLIDFPPDTYAHVAFYGLPLAEVRDVIVTHTHYDHFYADDLENRGEKLFYPRTDEPLTVHAFDSAQKLLAPLKVTASGSVRFHKLQDFEPCRMSGMTVTPLPASHSTRACSHIYDIFDGTHRLLYSNDSGLFLSQVWDYFQNAKVHYDMVSLDCTYVMGRSSDHHMNFEENAHIRERFLQNGYADGDTVFLSTHFSHNGGMTHDEIERTAASYGMIAAYDTLSVEV